MHGGINSDSPGTPNEVYDWRTIGAKFHEKRWFIGFVVIPTLLVALYFALFASDQYVSEAHFEVRSSSERSPTPSGLGQVLGLVGGVTASQSDSLGVNDYLMSHDAVEELERHLPLIAMFRRPGTDFISRLRPSDPTPETLLRYYQHQVSVHFDTETGITTLKVRAFSPQDAYVLTQTLLNFGERRVNDLNKRSYQSSLAVAQSQLTDAEADIARNQTTITDFRQSDRDVDPTKSATAQLEVVSQLRGQLALARAAQSSATGLRPDSPQARVLAEKVRSLEIQVAAENSRLSGGTQTIATGLGRYESLRLRQDFAAKRYAAAAAALQDAREQAMKQQLFVVRVVEPNLPVKSLYPQRLLVTLTIFCGLMLAYGIGWLMVAGVREHAS